VGAVSNLPSLLRTIIVFFGNLHKKVFAVDRATGALAWDFSTGSFIDSSPACNDGILFIGSNDGIVYALNETNGAVKWQTAIGGVRFSSVTLSEGRLYIGGQAAISALRQPRSAGSSDRTAKQHCCHEYSKFEPCRFPWMEQSGYLASWKKK
jgi:hypothetical protein